MSTITAQSLDPPKYRPGIGPPLTSPKLPIGQHDYDRLRQIASALLRRERPGHSLQSEDLLHEVFLRWMRSLNGRQFRDWDHLRRSAIASMQRALIDQARATRTVKRGCRPVCVEFDSHLIGAQSQIAGDVAVSQTLQRLSRIDQRKARVVELRVFSACSLGEIANELGLSTRTVRRDWNEACLFLRKELTSYQTNRSSLA